MGHHVDISSLSQEECSHIIDVIEKDISLRSSEEQRLRKISKELDERRKEIILKSSKRRYLDDNCAICGKMLFTFCCMFNRGHRCIACEHTACAACSHLFVTDHHANKHFLCFLCVKKREVKKQSFNWFYEAVAERFKRFGSAKVLRAIYECHKADPRVLNLIGLTRGLTFASASMRPSGFRVSATFPSETYGYPTSDEKTKEWLRSKHRSKSSDDILRLSRVKPHCRKYSAPATTGFNIQTVKTEKQATIRPLDATVEEEKNGGPSPANSELEVVSVDQLKDKEEINEAPFSVKFFADVKKKLLQKRSSMYDQI